MNLAGLLLTTWQDFWTMLMFFIVKQLKCSLLSLILKSVCLLILVKYQALLPIKTYDVIFVVTYLQNRFSQTLRPH